MTGKTSLSVFKERIVKQPFAWKNGGYYGFGITFENALIFYKESGEIFKSLPVDNLHLNGAFLTQCEFAPQVLH